MLGYVQNDVETTWAKKIEAKLDEDRTAHGIGEEAKVWEPVQLGEATKLLSYRSAHARAPGALDVFHTFLRCF
jgi:hypothetical protein